MPDLFFEQGDGAVAYAVKAFGSDHHLASDDVDQWGVVREQPKTGPFRVRGRSVLVSILSFAVTGCSPGQSRADPGTCNGQGFIAADPEARCQCVGLPVLRVGDKGLCVGIGSRSGNPVPVACHVSIGRSCQPMRGSQSGRPTPEIGAGATGTSRTTSESPLCEFHLIVEWSDGTPVHGAAFTAAGGGEETSGQLDDDGEAVFYLRADRCVVRLPEHDASLLLRIESKS